MVGTIALLAPGYALCGLLPAAIREVPLARWAAAPTLGFAAVTSLLITISWIGIPLGGLSVRLVLGAVVLAGVATWRGHDGDRAPAQRADLLEGLGLLAIVGGGLALALTVVGERPVPGNDWAKYLLYADEIRRHGALLIDNPFWMLGVPFREDPAVPAAYGGILLMSRAATGALAQGILVFAVLQILAVYAYARAFWGRGAGLAAAALIAAVPASQDILGWHGLANLAALALLGLLLAYLGTLARERLDTAAIVGMAITFVSLVATHRLTAVIAGAVLASTVAVAWLTGQRGALVDGAKAVGLALLLGIGVIADVWARQKTFGGTLPASSYDNTKVNLELAVRDLSWVLAIASLAGVVALAVTRRLERALWPAVALVVVCCALAYAYVIHLPLYYARMVFYLPLAMAPIAAVAAWRLLRPTAVFAVLAAAGVAAITVGSVSQAREVERFYSFASPASLAGLDALDARLKPGEIVVTDRCWSFLSTWLLRTRTLPALEPQDIQPKAELRYARQAHAILRGTPEGRRLARRYGVRYAVVDPTCPDANGRTAPPPAGGRAAFASSRLAVVRLPWVADD
ncbi:MAG: hypothetical protein JHC95_02355 [Solirubrobacteraceae bacterium]|nr:hypothetical protein [Solirubrobacteraceae bacterium]